MGSNIDDRGRSFDVAQERYRPYGDGPVRSGDPERDWYFESRDPRASSASPYDDPHQLNRMRWRAAGAQDYPGGALDQLVELSQRSRGSHQGKGPKNYRRSDELLREIICESLTDDPFIDAADVDVSVADGEVTLTGTVETRSQKRAIEDLVADIRGVLEIHNMIALRSDEIENRMSGL